MKRYSLSSIFTEAFRDNLGWEKAWTKRQPKKEYEIIIVGGGNTGRNTTIIRSNYLQESSIGIYEKSRFLYETLSQDLNYNIMFSPRGVLMLCQTEHELRAMKRTSHANRINGVDTKMVAPEKVKEIVPIINIDGPRFPVLGALWQPRGGTARHDLSLIHI